MRKKLLLSLVLICLGLGGGRLAEAASCLSCTETGCNNCSASADFENTCQPLVDDGTYNDLQQCCVIAYSGNEYGVATYYESDDCDGYAPPGEIGAPSESGGAYYFFDDFWLDSNGTMVRSVYNNTGSLINIIVRNLFIVAGILFFALIVFSGFKLIFMGDKAKALNSVKQYLTTGVIGLLIMFVAYWVVQLIEILTGGNIL